MRAFTELISTAKIGREEKRSQANKTGQDDKSTKRKTNSATFVGT